MPTLVYSDVEGLDRAIEVGSEPIYIGRGMECTIRSEDARVSRQHARVWCDQNGVWIEDLRSSNGVFLGGQRIGQSLIPVGEVVIIGSIMLRLMSSEGTLPPPVGVHGTLAQWLISERQMRAAIEQERSALASRVAELHNDIRVLVNGNNSGRAVVDPDIVRQRDEAEAKAAQLEIAVSSLQESLSSVQQRRQMSSAEVMQELDNAHDRIRILESQLSERSSAAQWSSGGGSGMADLTKLKGSLDEANAARKVAEQTAATERADAKRLRAELETNKKNTAKEIEQLRTDLGKAKDAIKDAVAMAQTQGGLAASAKLADLEKEYAKVKAELEQARRAANSASADDKNDKLKQLTEKLEKAEKRATAAEIRAQGAERNVSHANAQTANAERKVAELQSKLDENAKRTVPGQVFRLSGQFPVANQGTGAEGATVLTAEPFHDEPDTQVGTQAQRKITALEGELANSDDIRRKLEAELAAAHEKLATAERAGANATELAAKLAAAEKMLSASAGASEQIEAARKERDEAIALRKQADLTVEDAEKRTVAAETLSKSMAKDVSEALRKSAESDNKLRAQAKELVAANDKAAKLAAELATAKAEAATALEQTKAAAASALEQTKAAAASELIAERQRAVAAALAPLQKSEAELRGQVADLQQKIDALTKAAKTKQDHDNENANRAGEKYAQLERNIDRLEKAAEAERSAALALNERKNQLERELHQARNDAAALRKQNDNYQRELANLAEAVADLTNQLSQSRTEVEQNANAGKVADEAKLAARAAIEHATQTAERTIAAAKAELAAEQKATLAEFESRLNAAQSAIDEYARERDQQKLRITELTAANGDLREQLDQALERLTVAQTNFATQLKQSQADQADATDSEMAQLRQRALEAESHVERLASKVEAADLAIGRTSALQRQLDEALLRLSRSESPASASSADTATRMQVLQAELSAANSDNQVLRQQVETLRVQLAHIDEAEQAQLVASLRSQVADLQHELAASLEQPPTTKAKPALPAGADDHLATLTEAIDSLRANLRAASDETQAMAPSDGVAVVSDAIGSAAEQVDLARKTLRALMQLV